MKAIVNRIIPFSSVDGPGNRTAVFLQGCNLNCKYCHNPETRVVCENCGICVSQCPAKALTFDRNKKVNFHSEKCLLCDTCIRVCPYSSSPKVREMTAKEVYEVVKHQIPFIRGVTVSGGECMLYPEFLLELFTLAAQAGLGTLIDSNGTIPFCQYPELLRVTDGVMLDIKAFDRTDHERITGFSNETVLENVRFLLAEGKLEEIRVVVVQDLYDARESVSHIADLLSDCKAREDIRIKLIAYRPMGVRKEYSGYQIPSPDFLEELAELIRAKGYRKIVMI